MDGPQALWITADRLDEQRRLLPSIAFERLWLNTWTSGGGDALTKAVILAAVDESLKLMQGDEPGFQFVAGLDLGVKHDASAFCVLAVSIGHTERRATGRGTYCEWGEVQPEYENIHHKGDRSVRLAKTWTWRPSADGSVDLDAIEGTILDASKRFKIGAVFYDPWQATHLAQRLRRASVRMQEVTFVGPSLQAMATATLEVFNSLAVRLYPEEQLLSDLRKLRVIEKSYGFRLESPRDATGHGDLATVFLLALLGARDLKPKQNLQA